MTLLNFNLFCKIFSFCKILKSEKFVIKCSQVRRFNVTMERLAKKSRLEKSKKHPPHLKGKEIGLYYARLNKEKRKNSGGPSKKDHFLKCVGSVTLSNTKQNSITKLLKTLDKNQVVNDEEMPESLFKRRYVNAIRTELCNTIRDDCIERDDLLDKQLYEEFMNKQNHTKYREMLKIRKTLPSYNYKENIIEAVNRNQVIVITGETGCGKTTQVSQFILDDYIKNKNGSLCSIYCTQPRRISAYSVAERVAAERAENLGESVGYQIRLEGISPRRAGSILYCTTGVLIRQLQEEFSVYMSHLILDEIHERDSNSDFLMTYIKNILSTHKNLKVILMSATLNSDKFSEYFDNCETLHIPGLTYPVKEYYLEDVLEMLPFEFPDGGKAKEDYSKHVEFIMPYVNKLKKSNRYSKTTCKELLKPTSEDINLHLIMELISYICHRTPSEETILVFLTGYGEISKLHNIMRLNKFKEKHYYIYPLYSRMASNEQRLIFNTPPKGIRKIILSTNIAETSITINDVVHVIDCGKIKMTHLHLDTYSESLDSVWVSLANARQRRGRAGRNQPGICYHLITKHRFKHLEEFQKPEILRKRLEGTVLNIKILRLGDAKSFLNLFMDSPCAIAGDNAINLLQRLDALDDNENLTPLGYHLAKLPLNPQLGKMIILASWFGCLDPVLTVASTFDYKEPFYCPLGKEIIVDQKKFEFSKGWKSDHLLMVEVMKQFESFGDRHFCYENFLSYQTLDLLRKMKQQFADILYEMNFISKRDVHSRDSNYNSDNLSLVKAIVCAGLYPNFALMPRKKSKYPTTSLKTIDNDNIYLHPSSVLTQYANWESNLLVYFKRLKCGRDYIFDASMVHPLPLVFFGDRFTIVEENSNFTYISINGKIRFKCNKQCALTIKELRDKLNLFLTYKVSHPGHVNWDRDNDEKSILQSIMDLITTEDLDLDDESDSISSDDL